MLLQSMNQKLKMFLPVPPKQGYAQPAGGDQVTPGGTQGVTPGQDQDQGGQEQGQDQDQDQELE